MPEDRQLTAPATLLDIMRDRAERYRHKVAFDYSTGAEEHGRLSYHELDIKARAIASTLQRQGAAGERALPADEAPGRAGRGAGEIADWFVSHAVPVAVPPQPAQPDRLRSSVTPAKSAN
jgi:hypothetical protein